MTDRSLGHVQADRRFVLRLAGASLLSAGTVATRMGEARAWPARPVRLVVAYPPGGASDGVARLLAQHLARRWGVPVVVENRPGAGGALAMEHLARSPADGHTLCFSAITPLTLSPASRTLRFDPVADVAAVASVVMTPVLVVGSPTFGAATLAEALGRSMQSPVGLRWATSGLGTTGHLVMEQVQRASGANIVHIPYSGGARQLNDTMAGHVDLLSSNAAEPALTHVADGRLLPLAVGAPKRLAALPDVPTLAELGFPAANRASEFGVFAPAGMPAALLELINRSVNDVLDEPAVRLALVEANHLPTGGSAQALDKTLRTERALAQRLLQRN